MTAAGASQRLFHRWREVAAEFDRELALADFATGRRWTFGELDRASERFEGSAGPVAFPAGNGVEFILALLAAWRDGKPACPLEPGQKAPEFPTIPPDYAHLKLTSASTGAAKCIAFTPEQLAADPANIIATMGLRTEWPNLACISLSHSYGFSNLVLPLLLHGIPLLLVPAPLPQLILEAARDWTALTLPAVPALWRSWLNSQAIPGNIRRAISAGAPLPVELEAAIFSECNLKVHNFYGSSECGGIAYDRTEVPRKSSAFVGTALDHVTLALSSAGTLIVESAAVGSGYWPDGQPSLQGGRFETTDLAELTGSGVVLRGRLSDIINVAGRKAVPENIEAALKAHPDVRECVVFGISDPRHERFETITACVHAERPVTIPELTAFLSQSLPAWQIPRQWWFTDELRTNERGKLSRAEWRRRFEARGR